METQTQKPNFIQDWTPFEKLYKDMERKILQFFRTGKFDYQKNHSEQKKQFKPVIFKQIDDFAGLAYTSTGIYAGLWICNGGYIWANDTHHFTGFAIDVDGKFWAIAEDENENEIYLPL